MKKLITGFLAFAFLWVSQSAAGLLIDPYRFSAVIPSLSFVACTTDSTALTTYTYTTHNIGTASATRTVIVVVMSSDSTTDYSVSSMTIGGVSANEQSDSASAASAAQSAIYSLNVAAGTTATIAVTYSEAIQESRICVWAAYDLTSSTATATNAAGAVGSTPLTLSVNTSADGIVLGGCANSVNTASTYSWSGLTENTDVTTGLGTMSDASFVEDATPASPLAITCTFAAGTGNHGGASAAFR